MSSIERQLREMEEKGVKVVYAGGDLNRAYQKTLEEKERDDLAHYNNTQRIREINGFKL